MKRTYVFAISLALLLPFTLPSHAQFFNRLKQAAKDKAEQTVTEPIDNAPTSVPKPAPEASQETPAPAPQAAPAAAPAPTQQAASATTAANGTPASAGGEPNLVAVPIDFIPGEKTIFYDDFSDMPPGEPPPHWTVRNGMMQLRMGGGIRELYTGGGSGVNLTSPSFAIPTNFTFQLVCNCQGASHWEFQDKDGRTIFKVSVEGAQDHETVSASVEGPDGVAIGSSGDVKVVSGKPDELDLWAQQGRVRAYLNGKRFGDVNNIKFAPMSMLYASDFDYRPTGIRSVRVAESAPDPGTILATTGKYVTHGILFRHRQRRPEARVGAGDQGNFKRSVQKLQYEVGS